ncbi:MAG: hypothetical protein QXO97_09285 [Candidatus Nezhaarchaeales archaeon]
MRVSTVFHPYTRWNLLESFIVQLAVEGESICSNRVSSDGLYNALVDLVCGVNTGEALHRIKVSNPVYPYIFTVYYLLFDRCRLVDATRLYEEIGSSLSVLAVGENELKALFVMERVLEFFTALKAGYGRCSENLKEHLEVFVSMLENSRYLRCEDLYEWGCMFRELVLAELDPDLARSIKRLEQVKNEVEKKTAYLYEVDEEVAEGYNLILDTASSPIYTFLEKRVEKMLKNLESKRIELENLTRRKNEVKEKAESIANYLKKLHLYAEPTAETSDTLLKLAQLFALVLPSATAIVSFSIFQHLVAFIFLVAYLFYIPQWIVLKRLNRTIKKIEREIERLGKYKIETTLNIICTS